MKRKITVKKTKLFVKRAGKKAGVLAKGLKKEWKRAQPQRKKLKKVAGKAFKYGTKIGIDVYKTIKRDVKEINRGKKGKK